ncbi:MFS transporter [Flexivirga meconopsidis]|uniref:MFS transporter n=1 Tax=Flexivirga meconopsidis TaxID=2977121 RepID=UPI00223F3552|nr:MFS transporter [Flexivirga meconopsidis]
MSSLTAVRVAAPHRLLLPLLAFCQLIVAIDYNIVLVALPRMQEALGFSPSSLQWVVSAYALAFGGVLLFAGRFTDIFGQRIGMFIGLALYGLGSGLAAVAGNPALVLVGRVAQGLGGALLTPSVLSTIFRTYAEGPARFKALAVWSGAGAVGLASGSALGGILTSATGWRGVFVVNIPLVVLALVGAAIAMPRDAVGAERPRLDVPGAILATIGSVGVVFALAQGPAEGWGSRSVVAAALAGIAALAAFVVVERNSAHPLLPLHLLGNRVLTIGLVSMLLFLGSIGTSYYVFTLFLQDVLGRSALVTGLAFLPWGVAGIVGSKMAESVLDRWGVTTTLCAGMVIGAAGTAALALTIRTTTPVWVAVVATLVLALGQAMGFASLFASAAAGVDPEHQGVTSALMSTCQQIGNAAGLAFLGALAAAVATRSGAPTASDTASGLRLVSWIAAGMLVVGAVIALGGRTRQPGEVRS